MAPGFMVSGQRVMAGFITGTPWDAERTLDFSVLADVRARIESMPLERAQEAFDRMRRGDAVFRMVLTMGQ